LANKGDDMAQCDEKQPTFEESLAQLEATVRAIEEGKIGLQEAIDQYEKGMQLIQRCRDMLTDAEAKVQQLQLTDDNQLVRAPMEMPKDDKNDKK
jgi:exodeoxyribonuclease VII small subunit